MSKHGSKQLLDPNSPPRLTPAASGESAYYADRRADAKKALAEALRGAKSRAGDAADPDARLGKVAGGRPWVSLAGAAAAGLAAGYVVTPSKDRKLAKRLATIERLLDDEAKARGVKVDGGSAKPSWLSWGLKLAMRQLRPMLISTLTGLVTGAAGGAAAGSKASEDAPEPADRETADVT